MSASVELICVDPGRIHHVWDSVASRIKRAIMRGGDGLFDQVEQDVLCGKSLLWLAWDKKEVIGAGVTSLQKTDNGKVCVIVAWNADDMRLCLPLLKRIEFYAKDEGCKSVRLYGRKGWTRVLRDYRQPSIVLEKEI